jgi:hypothetical protein
MRTLAARPAPRPYPTHHAWSDAMPDPTVTVTYDPNAGEAWQFTPKTIHVSAPGLVILQRAPGSTWTFQSVAGLPSGYTTTRTGNGQQLSIMDPHTAPFGVSYPFSVTVVDAQGASHTSPMMNRSAAGDTGGPPPIIINDGLVP